MYIQMPVTILDSVKLHESLEGYQYMVINLHFIHILVNILTQPLQRHSNAAQDP